MQFDVDTILEIIQKNPLGVISVVVFSMILIWTYLGWSNRKSKSSKNLQKLTEADNEAIEAALRKTRKGVNASNMPRFFQEHKIETSEGDAFVVPLVLVVDDSKTALLAATQALKDAPYRIVTALDGRVAWQKMLEERPALVITDLEMPNVNGLELLRRMRADLRFLDVPVVLVTAHPFNNLKEGRVHGVNGFLPKPYAAHDLRDQVAFFLREAS